MQWELIANRGMRIGDTEVVISAPRADTRAALAPHMLPPSSPRRPSEDQYDQQDGTMLFLRYDDADTLQEIMLLDSHLHVDGLELLDTTWTELAPALQARGYSIAPSAYFADGQDCPELGINIATREETGGDGDGIAWVAVWRPD